MRRADDLVEYVLNRLVQLRHRWQWLRVAGQGLQAGQQWFGRALTLQRFAQPLQQVGLAHLLAAALYAQFALVAYGGVE